MQCVLRKRDKIRFRKAVKYLHFAELIIPLAERDRLLYEFSIMVTKKAEPK